jgi:hypothetical protein
VGSERHSPWSALDGTCFYLGRSIESAFQIALLDVQGKSLAPLFTSREAASPFLLRAPAGVELLELAADDLRAKEEWLTAAAAQGGELLAVDPDPLSLEPTGALPLDAAQAYVLSHRRATACL